jgi:hypothetical protein
LLQDGVASPQKHTQGLAGTSALSAAVAQGPFLMEPSLWGMGVEGLVWKETAFCQHPTGFSSWGQGRKG